MKIQGKTVISQEAFDELMRYAIKKELSFEAHSLKREIWRSAQERIENTFTYILRGETI